MFMRKPAESLSVLVLVLAVEESGFLVNSSTRTRRTIEVGRASAPACLDIAFVTVGTEADPTQLGVNG